MTVQDLIDCTSREALAAKLRPSFVQLADDDRALSPMHGGRKAGLALLEAVKPKSYASTRNFLGGDVTRLSAYLRHGVLTLAEVRDHVLERIAKPEDAGKLINEFGWRDYWQRLYDQLGEGIWQDREPLKTGYQRKDYAADLGADIAAGTTTLACVDGFAHELVETGYLHNHARMWFAAYVVHWRRTRWQAGATWFLEHLVDGDPASNNLSWQWVASTFASKPYIFNRENLERYTAGAYCRHCPHAQDRTCPFEAEYETLDETLFPQLHDARDANEMPPSPRPAAPAAPLRSSNAPGGTPLVWVHTDSLNPESPALAAHPEGPAVFVWDTEWLAASRISLKRIVFLAECLQEMPGKMELRFGDPATELLAAAKAAGAGYLLAQRTPDPRLQAAAAKVQAQMPVVWFDPPAFVRGSRTFDLKRFSRYWQRAQSSAMQLTEPDAATLFEL